MREALQLLCCCCDSWSWHRGPGLCPSLPLHPGLLVTGTLGTARAFWNVLTGSRGCYWLFLMDHPRGQALTSSPCPPGDVCGEGRQRGEDAHQNLPVPGQLVQPGRPGQHLHGQQQAAVPALRGAGECSQGAGTHPSRAEAWGRGSSLLCPAGTLENPEPGQAVEPREEFLEDRGVCCPGCLSLLPLSHRISHLHDLINDKCK